MSGDVLMDNSASETEDVDQLNSIFDDPECTKFQDEDGRRRWRCGWCTKEFAGWNATKALQHLNKITKVDITPCKGKINNASAQRYRSLYDLQQQKKRKNASNNEAVRRSIDSNNDSAASALYEQRNSKKKQRIFDTTTTKTPSKEGFETPSDTKGYLQMKIHNGPNPVAEYKMTMAVGDLIHSCGLPFSLASHPKFQKVVQLAK